jgi:acetyltransferase AlgX (SGNH hydrolase-like protein)
MRRALRLFSATGWICACLVIGSPLFYLFLEASPSAIYWFGLYRVDHFATLQAFVPDKTLVYRNRQPSYFRIFNLRAVNYGIDAPLRSILYRFDTDGFRNAAHHGLSDVVLIGDSMVEYGDSDGDILVARLERLSGLSATSFGVGGYGPFHYLELFKRYGLQHKPKYALFCFYEDNDLGDIAEYLKWKSEGRYYDFGILSAGFWSRYGAAIKSTAQYLHNRIRRAFRNPEPTKSLADLANLRLQNDDVQMLLADKVSTETTENMLKSDEWKNLKSILVEFRDLAHAHQILPMIVYIPLAAHIYAEYSTPASGENWLKVRDEQIAAQANAENAMIRLARELQIELIDLTPAFKAKAKAGRVLYYPYDQHWNSEGRETAAAVITEALRKNKNISPREFSVKQVSAATAHDGLRPTTNPAVTKGYPASAPIH